MRVIEIFPAGADIRQGAIIQFGTASGQPYNCVYAAVLTADCDIAQSKHYGQLLVCPIVPIKVLLRTAWAARRLQKIGAAARHRLHSQFNDALGDTQGSLSETTISALIQSSANIKAALATLSITPNEHDRMMSNAKICELCGSPGEDRLDVLIKAYSLRDRSTNVAAESKIMKEFREELKADSADIVVIPDEMGGNNNSAAVILLRSPFSVTESEISQEYGATARPVAQLCAPVKYLVAQKFGYLFSRFGMPVQVERDRDAAVDMEELSREG